MKSRPMWNNSDNFFTGSETGKTAEEVGRYKEIVENKPDPILEELSIACIQKYKHTAPQY